jgi:hypothetical protein
MSLESAIKNLTEEVVKLREALAAQGFQPDEVARVAAEAPATPEPAPEPEPEKPVLVRLSDVEPTPAAEKPKISASQVGAAAMVLGAEKGVGAAKAVLGEFGAKRAGEIQPDDYQAFIKRAHAESGLEPADFKAKVAANVKAAEGK